MSLADSDSWDDKRGNLSLTDNNSADNKRGNESGDDDDGEVEMSADKSASQTTGRTSAQSRARLMERQNGLACPKDRKYLK